jgi:ElaB/YqjD/DUF883 family membrane-anchored ribosome-binding protein
MTQAQTPGRPVTQAAAEQAEELRDTVKDHASEVASSARDQAGEVARTARSETQQVVDRTRSAVETEARQRTEALAHSVRNVGDGLRALADGRPEDAGPVAGYARDAASRVGDVAQRLESRGYDGLVDDVSRFARRRPGVFLAGAGLLGFAIGRIIRSGGASGSGNGAGRVPSSGVARPNIAMADATISMQPVMPRGEPSSIPASRGTDGGNAGLGPEIR